MLGVAFRNVYYSVRGRPYKSIVKSKSYSVLWGQMSVYYVAVKLVRVSERGKQSLRLSSKIVFGSNVYKPLATQILHFLVIAENSAFFRVLSIVQEGLHSITFSLDKYQWN